MSTNWKHKVYQGAFLLAVADAASRGIGGILALLMARLLGPYLYGQYAIAASICMIVMTITVLGFEQEFTKKISIDQRKIPKYLKLNFLWIGVTSLIAYFLIVIIFLTSSYDPDVVLTGIILGAAYVIRRFHLPFRHLCLVLNKSKITALIQSLGTVVLVIATLVIIQIYKALIPVVIVELLVVSLITVGWFMWLPRRCRDYKTNQHEFLSYFKRSIPFALTNIIWIIYFNFDTYMLSLFKPEQVVGVYAGVFKIFSITYIIGYAFTNSFTPLLFKQFKEDKKQYQIVTRHLLKTMGFIGVPIAFLLYFSSIFLIPFILGEGYMSGVAIAQVLSIAVFFRFMNFSLGEILTTSDNQNKRIFLEICLLIINIFLNYLLIPPYGGTGAAIATVASEIFLFIAVLIVCFNKKLIVFRLGGA